MTTDTGFVLWLTGLSGAGRSTVAAKLAPALAERGHGRGARRRRGPDQPLPGPRLQPRDRDTNIARIGYVAGKLSKHGVAVLVAAISPYRAARDQVRTQVDTFVEVYVAAPVSTCAERDPKGLYAKALAGEIKNFTGVSDPTSRRPTPRSSSTPRPRASTTRVHQVIAWLEDNQLTSPSDR